MRADPDVGVEHGEVRQAQVVPDIERLAPHHVEVVGDVPELRQLEVDPVLTGR